MPAMQWSDFERLKHYTGFDAASADALQALHASARQSFSAIVADFYDAIARDEVAAKVITGGEAQVDRLKRTLLRWLDSTLLGPHDAAYFETRARIGMVHVKIELPLLYMVAAMNRVRHKLTDLADSVEPSDRRRLTIRAINQILDLELAIMIDAYRSHIEERLRSRERLATIGQLAASIGHELRNPLGIIETSVYLMEQRPSVRQDAILTKHTAKIGAQVKVCSSTITELLELAKSRPPRKRPTSVRALAVSALEATPLEDPSRVILDIAEGLEAQVDPDQFRQVLVNLLQNAEQAQEGEGRIWVSAELTPEGVVIRVKDEGPGVPSAAREAIFDALYTTKPRGTGLGLALCRRIVEAHDGDIIVEDTAKGASFRICLKTAPSEPVSSSFPGMHRREPLP